MDKDIPTVKVDFLNMPYLVMTLVQWKDLGGYQGMLKNMNISILDVVKVNYILMDAKDYPTEVWEG